jgi:hypothetical protein
MPRRSRIPMPQTEKFYKSLDEHLTRYSPAERQRLLQAGEAVAAQARARVARRAPRPTPPKPTPTR